MIYVLLFGSFDYIYMFKCLLVKANNMKNLQQ